MSFTVLQMSFILLLRFVYICMSMKSNKITKKITKIVYVLLLLVSVHSFTFADIFNTKNSTVYVIDENKGFFGNYKTNFVCGYTFIFSLGQDRCNLVKIAKNSALKSINKDNPVKSETKFDNKILEISLATSTNNASNNNQKGDRGEVGAKGKDGVTTIIYQNTNGNPSTLNAAFIDRKSVV